MRDSLLDPNAIASEFNSLALDSSTDITEAANSTVTLECDIVIHPIFGVLAPYLRLWDGNGSYLSVSALEQWFEKCGKNVASDSNFDSVFIAEEHPYYGYPCFTLHVCGIEKLMQHLASSTVSSCPGDDGCYLLRWLTMVGPTIGLVITPHFFAQVSPLFEVVVDRKLRPSRPLDNGPL